MDLELNLSHDQYVNNMSYTSDFEFFENICMWINLRIYVRRGYMENIPLLSWLWGTENSKHAGLHLAFWRQRELYHWKWSNWQAHCAMFEAYNRFLKPQTWFFWAFRPSQPVRLSRWTTTMTTWQTSSGLPRICSKGHMAQKKSWKHHGWVSKTLFRTSGGLRVLSHSLITPG